MLVQRSRSFARTPVEERDGRQKELSHADVHKPMPDVCDTVVFFAVIAESGREARKSMARRAHPVNALHGLKKEC